MRGLGVPQLGIHPIIVAVMPVYDCRSCASISIGISFLTFVDSDAITEMLARDHTYWISVFDDHPLIFHRTVGKRSCYPFIVWLKSEGTWQNTITGIVWLDGFPHAARLKEGSVQDNRGGKIPSGSFFGQKTLSSLQSLMEVFWPDTGYRIPCKLGIISVCSFY